MTSGTSSISGGSFSPLIPKKGQLFSTTNPRDIKDITYYYTTSENINFGGKFYSPTSEEISEGRKDYLFGFFNLDNKG